jgi:hypothetical protein
MGTHTARRVQEVIREVEQCSLRWGFKFSIEKPFFFFFKKEGWGGNIHILGSCMDGIWRKWEGLGSWGSGLTHGRSILTG